MPNFTDLAGLTSVASAMAASLLWLPLTKRLARARLAMLQCAVFAVALLPFDGFPLAAYVRGATGDLSITTIVLLWCALLGPWTSCAAAAARHRLSLVALIAPTAVGLYPMALGLGAFDPYRLGYGNGLFIALLFLIALTTWLRKYYLVTLCIALAALAWAIGWYESDNLWDYLLDPFVSIYALAALLIHARKIFAKPSRLRIST